MAFNDLKSPFENFYDSYQLYLQDASDLCLIPDIRMLDVIFDLGFHSFVNNAVNNQRIAYAMQFFKESLKELSGNSATRADVLKFLLNVQTDARLKDQSRIVAMVQVVETYITLAYNIDMEKKE